ncbi:MAG: HAD-IIB family hydrolase [Minisyncoccia bacterium]
MFFGFDLAHLIGILGYPGLFAIIMAESGLFFAVYLPGGSLLFTSGLLASQGFLNIYILLPVVIVAAIVGDTIGYWFGSWVGPALWRRPDSRFFKKKYLEQTRHFFKEHGTRTIFLARFIPIVRTFAPILAGVGEMHYRTFLFYNVLGAITWGGGFVLGGYFLGEVAPGVDEYLEYFILGIIGVTSIPFFWHVYKAQNAGATAKTATLPKALIFDVDDTLAESFHPPTDDILQKLALLAGKVPIAIMSGGSFDRMERDILKRIHANSAAKFYVFSDNAARCTVWRDGMWHEIYNHALTPGERQAITIAIKNAVRECRTFDGQLDTSRILDRETSVAFAALPHDATFNEKRAWDQDSKKRNALASTLRHTIPEFEIMIGGKTTIDITQKGVTKKYGVEWLAKDLSLEPSDMLFIGDGFSEGGNDAVVIPTGIQIKETSGPNETLEIIDDFLEKFEAR